MAVLLLLAGAAVWAFSTWAGAGVLAAEVGDDGGRFSRYYGSPYPAEVQLNGDLFDVQVGALLVLGCAVAVLLCRRVRGLGDVLAILIALPCVLIVVNAILTRAVGSSLTAALAGGLVLVVVCVAFAEVATSWFMPSPQHRHNSSAGRLLLLAFALMAAGAVAVMETLKPAGWIVEVLTGLVSIPVVQGALVVAMLGLVAVMAVRWTVGVVAAAAVITVLGGWLVLAPVFTLFDGPWVVALGAVLVMAAATAAISGSEDPRPRLLTRLFAVVATAAAFCVALLPAGYIGMIFGVLAQTFAGGELGADGGPPWLMGGALAGLAGFAGYAAVLMRPNQPVAGEPPASPTGDLLTHAH
jgi:hypothetical protein